MDLSLPALESISSKDEEKAPPPHEVLGDIVDNGQVTFRICISGLAVSWVVSVIALVLGPVLIKRYHPPVPNFLSGTWMTMGFLNIPFPKTQSDHYIDSHIAYSLPHSTTIAISFLLNLALTALLDALNCIHATALRWIPLEKDPPHFNSNSRFFVSSRHAPCHWTINIISAASYSLSYAAISLLTTQIYLLGLCDPTGYQVVTTDVNGPRYGLDFSGWALLLVGLSVLINACISTWTLFYSRRLIRSWNPDPIVNAIIFATDSKLLFDNLRNRPVSAKADRRQSPVTMMRHLRSSRILLWAVATLIIVWLIAVSVSAVRTGATTSDAVYEQTNQSNVSAFWQAYGLVYLQYYNPHGNRRDALGVVIQASAQSVLTLGLHAADNIVNVAKDELRWRELSSGAGARVNISWLRDAILSWSRVVIIALKAAIQWIFGYAFTVNLAVFMALLPIVVLAASLLALAALGEWVVRWRPRGPQPPAFGNLSLMSRLIMEGDVVLEGEKLYWKTQSTNPNVPSPSAEGSEKAMLAQVSISCT